MKTVFILFLAAFLPACTVYTVTNKVNQDLKIKTAGGDEVTLKASDCIELREYFLGLAGDFPFAVIGGVGEYSVGHYEITLKAVAAVGDTANVSANASGNVVSDQYTVSVSHKNIECESTSDKAVKIDDNTKVPVCGDKADKANCTTGTAKCVTSAENKKVQIPACVNDKNESLNDVAPTCKEPSLQPNCLTSMEIDSQTQAICLDGEAKCSTGTTAKCVKGNDASSIPSCLNQNNQKVENASLVFCANGQRPICLKPVVVEKAVVIPTPQCGSGQNPQCASGGTPICGLLTGAVNKVNQPYCVNKNNIRWVDDVRCSGVGSPNCDSVEPQIP